MTQSMFGLCFLSLMLMYGTSASSQIVPNEKSIPDEIKQEIKAAGVFCKPHVTYRHVLQLEGRLYSVDYNAEGCKSFCDQSGCKLSVYIEDQDRAAKIVFDKSVNNYQFRNLGLILSTNENNPVCKNISEVECKRTYILREHKFIPVRTLPRFSKPADLISSLYKNLESSNMSFDRDLFDQVFTKDIVALLVLNRALSQSQSFAVGNFETPWFDGQEGSPVNVQYNTSRVSKAEAKVSVSYTNSDDGERRVNKVDFSMKKTSEGWRILDVNWPSDGANDNKTLKSMLNNSLVSGTLGD